MEMWKGLKTKVLSTYSQLSDRPQPVFPAIVARLFCLVLAVLLVSAGPAPRAQDVDDCLTCHEDPDLTTERDGFEVSLFLDIDKYHSSVHGDMDCIDCHQDLIDVEFPTWPVCTASWWNRGRSSLRNAGIVTALTILLAPTIPTRE